MTLILLKTYYKKDETKKWLVLNIININYIIIIFCIKYKLGLFFETTTYIRLAFRTKFYGQKQT